MSDLQRCDNCQGRKNVLGMGAMMKPCPACHAVGWIERPKKKEKQIDIEEALAKPVEIDGLKNANGNPVPATKKYGRKNKEAKL